MSKIKRTTLIGSSFIVQFTDEETIYKIELCEIAAGRDYNNGYSYTPIKGWVPCTLTRTENLELLEAIEQQARLMDPLDFERWEEILHPECRDRHRHNNQGW